MSITAIPTFWLDKTQTDTLKALARSGGPGAMAMLRTGRPTFEASANNARQSYDDELLLHFRAADDYTVTLLIVNLGTEPMLLVEAPSYPWGDLRAAPVVYQTLSAAGVPSDPVSQNYSWDTNKEWGNYWIDAAPTDALGAGCSAVGVFQFVKDYGIASGVGAAVKFSSHGGFDHCYVGGEVNAGSKDNCGAISLADCGSAENFYYKFVDGTLRFTDTDSAGSGAYCACSSKTDPFNCITAIIP